MSRRIGLLSLFVMLFGGLVWWSALPDPVSGSSFQEGEAGTAAPHDHAEHKHAAHDHAHSHIPAPRPGRAAGDFHLDAPSDGDLRIQKALRDPKGVEIEFIDTPLQDGMNFLADHHKLTIIIDEQSLTEEGVPVDEPINRTLSGIKLESALNIILEPLGLTHVIEDEVLKIMTVIHADKRRLTRVYQTGYLKQIGVEPDALSQTIQAVVEPAAWRGQGNQLAAAGETEGGNVGFGRGNPQAPGGGPMDPAAVVVGGSLLRNVQFKTDKKPQTKPLEQNAIQVLGDMLVISAPQSVHKKVQAVLVQLDRRWALEHGKK